MKRFFEVGMKNKKTGERIRLIVLAENVDEATHSVNENGALFGYGAAYEWTGSGPHYEDAK